RVVVGADRRGEPALADGTVEARRAAGAEHGGEQVERGRVGMRRAGRAPSEGELRLADVARPFAPAETGHALFGRPVVARRFAGGERTIAFEHLAQRVVGVDVADD